MKESCQYYSQVTDFDTRFGGKSIMIDEETGELKLQSLSGGLYLSGEKREMNFCTKAYPGSEARIYGVDILLGIDHVRDVCKKTFEECPIFKGELTE